MVEFFRFWLRFWGFLPSERVPLKSHRRVISLDRYRERLPIAHRRSS